MDFEQAARELEIDEATYISLVKRFYELTQDDLSALDRSLAASDLTNVHSAAHSIKGASASLGLWDIYEAASSICERAKEGTADSIADLASSVRRGLDTLSREMDRTAEGPVDDA